uniref:Beta-lactamase-related domain-containing protein n=1 Tax=Panagrolaimus sp. JU765 TaxID=591449 RepID=A0AC34RA32_9BILA
MERLRLASFANLKRSIFAWRISKRMADNIFGTCQTKYAKVEKVFRRNFADGWEREGASVAVYHKGNLVVDLHGGYADASSLLPWTTETRTVIFSATKAVGALCVAILVDRGHVKYDDLVTSFWPEFGQNGKANITVDWIMSHRAGLAAVEEKITLEDAKNPEKMAKIFERAKPNWEPGTKSGYHAITYGWLVDQIVRKVDPSKRGAAKFFREEVTEKHGIDFFMGLPQSEQHTVSRLTVPDRRYLLKEILYDPRVLIVVALLNLKTRNSLAQKILDNPDWIKLEKQFNTFNSPELHRLEQPAALGITKARDLGKIFALMLKGEIISKGLIENFKEPVVTGGLDEVIGAPMPKGHGFLYERHPVKPGKWLFGHPGYGGSTVMMDPEEDVVIAYVSNGLKTGMGELTRTYRLLRNAVFESL